MTQTAKILKHLQTHGHITALEALTEHKCFRLAARIKELREQGHDIRTAHEKHKNGTHARYEYA